MSQTTIYIFAKTQSKSHVIQLSTTKNATVDYLMLATAYKLQKDFDYVVRLDTLEVVHVLTANGKNKFQYQLKLSDTVEQLVQRQKKSNSSTDFIYLQIIERSYPSELKFTHKEDLKMCQQPLFRDIQQTLNIINTQNKTINEEKDFFYVNEDPAKCVENELRLTYPLPWFLPQQLIQKHYNRFLDEQKTNFIIRISKREKITPIGQNQRTKDLDYLEVIARPPLFLMGFFMVPLFVAAVVNTVINYILGQHYFYPSQNKIHRLRPVLVLRIPLLTTLVSVMVTAAFQTVFFYLMNIFNNRSPRMIARNYLKSVVVNYLFRMLIKGTSVLLTPNIISQVFKVLDPLGEDGTFYHFIFDEAYRADNYQYGYGGYHRDQRAREFLLVNREASLGEKVKYGFWGVFVELVKSFSPGYHVVK